MVRAARRSAKSEVRGPSRTGVALALDGRIGARDSNWTWPLALSPAEFPRTRRARGFSGRGPGKALTVYGNVNSGRQCLHERERAAQIEEAVGTAKGVGDHRSGYHDCFPGDSA